MCGIAGFVALTSRPVVNHARILEVMGNLIAHRGPDGRGSWVNEDLTVGLAHQRLAIIDLSDFAAQPMIDRAGRAISFNGEIYNYLELRGQHTSYSFETTSDTESILAVYDKLGVGTATALRGMFAFALWDPHRQRLLLSRDRFGIKPLYYTTTDGVLYFASEAKALLPFVPTISTDPSALAEYLTFQYTIGEQTLFRGIKQLLPAHNLVVERGVLNVERYWDIAFDIDFDHHKRHFIERTRQLVNESVEIHLRS
ncbi:MAG: asparagine synthetase B, partial [Actinobacteria bacterium]|nr:asparagine synthetase B [Actinomycetota bacterium]